LYIIWLIQILTESDVYDQSGPRNTMTDTETVTGECACGQVKVTIPKPDNLGFCCTSRLSSLSRNECGGDLIRWILYVCQSKG
jgi:hypothetical protein